MELVYHFALVLFSAGALWHLHNRPRIGVLAATVAGVAVAAFLTAAILAAPFGGFAFLRLSALAIFVHFPILLVGCAWIFRRHHQGLTYLLLAAAGSLPAVGAYATWVEPRWLEVSRVEIRSSKIDRPIRIAVVADLQAEAFGAYERRALEETLAAEPDLILLPGDYFQVDRLRRDELARRFQEHLVRSGFGAPMGAYAVPGDFESAGWTSLFDGTQVTAIDPPRGSLTTLELPELTLTALSRGASRSRRLGLTADEDRFHIVFGHAPDFALGKVPADLLVAGHVHGGQVRLPGIGPLITFSEVPRSWAAGVTDLGGGRTLVVSRGVGMERGHAPRLRFLCRPEIVVIDLLPQKKTEIQT